MRCHSNVTGMRYSDVVQNQKIVLLGLDPRTFEGILNDGNLVPEFSHDKAVLRLIPSFQKLGYRCVLGEARGESDVFLEFLLDNSTQKVLYDLNPAIVIFSGPENYQLKNKFPKAIGVVCIPAVNVIEEKGNLGAGWTAQMVIGLSNHIDFIITQNYRMKDTLEFLSSLLAEWQNKEFDRILVSPNGIEKSVVEEYRHKKDLRAITRNSLGLTDADFLIVNGGGLWRWTRIENLLHALSSDELPSNIHFLQAGISQPSNLDHISYQSEIFAISKSSRSHNRIHLKQGWQSLGDLRRYIAAADVGINLNNFGLENWQSQRVRVLEYLACGIPIISTPDDGYTEIECLDSAHFRLEGFEPDVEDWVEIIARVLKSTNASSSLDFQKIRECLDEEELSIETARELLLKIDDLSFRKKSNHRLYDELLHHMRIQNQSQDLGPRNTLLSALRRSRFVRNIIYATKIIIKKIIN